MHSYCNAVQTIKPDQTDQCNVPHHRVGLIFNESLLNTHYKKHHAEYLQILDIKMYPVGPLPYQKKAQNL